MMTTKPVQAASTDCMLHTASWFLPRYIFVSTWPTFLRYDTSAVISSSSDQGERPEGTLFNNTRSFGAMASSFKDRKRYSCRLSASSVAVTCGYATDRPRIIHGRRKQVVSGVNVTHGYYTEIHVIAPSAADFCTDYLLFSTADSAHSCTKLIRSTSFSRTT